MRTASFDYELPAERIAQQPVEPRDAARLLVDRGPGAEPDDRHVRDLPDLVGPGDLLVVNDTRVLPARLALRKATGGEAEVLLLEPEAVPGTWRALVRPGRRLPPGTLLYPGHGAATSAVDAAGDPVVEIGADRGEGVRSVRLLGDVDLDVLGEVPLPPYITEPLADPERYQTVYARRPASVAAPTAGLHLTAATLDACRARGASVAAVELVVGIGTFRPIAADDIAEHRMHAEHYRVPAEVLDACAAAERVVAVGTTTVRALESAAATGEATGRTDLFIHRPYRWRVVDALLTNFHLPRSSLLVMIDAFVGDRWRHLYDVALARRYRFLSFGDAMLLTRSEPTPPDGGRSPAAAR